MTQQPNEPCPYLIAHVSKCDEESDDGGELWEAEVQVVGGHAVAATIYAGSEAEARGMAEKAIAAWNTRVPAVQDEGMVEALRRARWALEQTPLVNVETERALREVAMAIDEAMSLYGENK